MPLAGLRPDRDIGEIAGHLVDVSLHELVLAGDLATKHTHKHMTWGIGRWVDNVLGLAVGVIDEQSEVA